MGTWASKEQADSRTFRDRTVSLPAQVKYASGMMFSISPTLTCVVVCFVLSEEMSKCYDAALKLDRETFLEPTARGSSIRMPFNQKEDDIWRARSRLATLVQAWFRDNLPGVFSSQLDDSGMPICELVTLSEAVPFPGMDEPMSPLYVRLLGLENRRAAWKYSDLPKLRFGFHSPSKKGPKNYATLAINLRHWREANSEREPHDAKSSLLSYVYLPIPELMSIWAVVPLLQNFAEKLVSIQNSTVFNTDQEENHVDVLRQLTSYVSGLSDLSAVSSDLDEEEAKLFRSLIFGSPFVPVRTDRHADSTTLDITLRRTINERAKWLRYTDRNIRDRLSQVGAFVAAQENVRLQKKISTLTWVILIVSTLAVAVTVFQLFLQDWVPETAQKAITQFRFMSQLIL